MPDEKERAGGAREQGTVKQCQYQKHRIHVSDTIHVIE